MKANWTFTAPIIISILALIVSGLSLYYSAKSFNYEYIYNPNVIEANILRVYTEVKNNNLEIYIDMEIRNVGKITNTIYFLNSYIKSESSPLDMISPPAQRIDLILEPGETRIYEILEVYEIAELIKAIDISSNKNIIGLRYNGLAKGDYVLTHHDVAIGKLHPMDINYKRKTINLLTDNLNRFE